MFVRIVHRHTDRRGEALIECDKILIDDPAVINDDRDDNYIRLTLQNTRDMRDDHHDIKKKDTEIYIMNNDGKTIDKYIW